MKQKLNSLSELIVGLDKVAITPEHKPPLNNWTLMADLEKPLHHSTLTQVSPVRPAQTSWDIV